jgi:biotin operon repressor
MAIDLIRALDGQKGAEALGAELSLDREKVDEIIEALRELGAVGGVSSQGSE